MRIQTLTLILLVTLITGCSKEPLLDVNDMRGGGIEYMGEVVEHRNLITQPSTSISPSKRRKQRRERIKQRRRSKRGITLFNIDKV